MVKGEFFLLQKWGRKQPEASGKVQSREKVDWTRQQMGPGRERKQEPSREGERRGAREGEA